MAVAFLTLSYSSFTHSEVMSKFFDTSKKDIFNLYIHNKEPIIDNNFCQYSIPNRIKTSWGHHSLVLATIELFKEALKDPNNSHFILISDSHCPLYNIEKCCELIKERYNILSFTKFPDGSGAPIHSRFRYALLFNKGRFRLSNACKVHQWFAGTRADAEFFVNSYIENERYFVKARNTYTDEFYFHLMANTYGLPIQFTNNCDVEWFRSTPIDIISKLDCREYPYTYQELTSDTINQMRSRGNVFCRKIYKDTQIDIEHLFYSS